MCVCEPSGFGDGGMGSDNRWRAARSALHPLAATSWDVGGVKEPDGASLSHLFPREHQHDATDVQKPDLSLIYIPNLPQNEINNNLNAFRQNTRPKPQRMSTLWAVCLLFPFCIITTLDVLAFWYLNSPEILFACYLNEYKIPFCLFSQTRLENKLHLQAV